MSMSEIYTANSVYQGERESSTESLRIKWDLKSMTTMYFVAYVGITKTDEKSVTKRAIGTISFCKRSR